MKMLPELFHEPPFSLDYYICDVRIVRIHTICNNS